MMKRTGVYGFLAFVSGVFLVLLFWMIAAKIPRNIFSFLDVGSYQVPTDVIEINAFTKYTQVFRANFDNLFMMSLFIPRQDLSKNTELLFRLGRADNLQNDLVFLKWRYTDIKFGYNNFYVIPPDRESTPEGFHFHFQFDPIKKSKNEDFYFRLESPEAMPGKGIKIGFWNSRKHYEALTKSSLSVNEMPIAGFIAFRTYHTWCGSPRLLFDQIRLRLLNDKGFFIFYSGMVVVILCALTGSLVYDWQRKSYEK